MLVSNGSRVVYGVTLTSGPVPADLTELILHIQEHESDYPVEVGYPHTDDNAVIIYLKDYSIETAGGRGWENHMAERSIDPALVDHARAICARFYFEFEPSWIRYITPISRR
jgi:hypothetical protein